MRLQSFHPLVDTLELEMTNGTPTIAALHTATDLKVADVVNAEWNRAPIIPIDRYWSGEVAPTDRHAEARILWSKQALHIRFACRQAEPLIVNRNPRLETKTMRLWDRDVCEIFIAPDPQLIERYFEFEAAPTGEWLDVAIHWTPDQRESDWNFSSHMSAAGTIEKERVIIAMRIPWNDWIHQPRAGEQWRVNLFRCVGKDPTRGYLAWQPTRTPQPNFHVPGVFGWLEFE